MSRYRHTVTGAERESSGKLGYPWELIEKQKRGRRKAVDSQDVEDEAQAKKQQDEAQAEAEDAAEAQAQAEAEDEDEAATSGASS